MTALTAVLAVLAAGYGLGRWRPWMRLGGWANWQLRFHLSRWDRTRLRLATLFVLLLATDPAATVWAWRHRNDPPAPPSPPVRLRDTRAPEEPTP